MQRLTTGRKPPQYPEQIRPTKATIQNLVRNFCIIIGSLLFAPASLAAIYYVHTDHLATPKVLTDQNQNVVWSSDAEPFGGTTTSGTGNFNLRFPGQYYDPESGLHYNYYRYYDPSSGRYITSDPIGLTAGLNTYAYVANNPLIFLDPLGLLDEEFQSRTNGQRIIIVPKDTPLIEGQSPLARGPVVNGLIGLATGAAMELAAGRFCPPLANIVTNSTNAIPSLQVPNAGGKIVSEVTKQDEVFFRVFSGNNTTGGFLTKVAPTSKKGAVEGLALPPGNNADFIQKVIVPAGTRLQRSRALPAFGRRGGKEQFQLLEDIPNENFGPGVPFQ